MKTMSLPQCSNGLMLKSRRAAALARLRGLCWVMLLFVGLDPLRAQSPAEKFQAECASKAAQAEKEGRMVIPGKDGWYYFTPELHHLGVAAFWGEAARQTSRSSKIEFADPLLAIVDFDKQLKKAGVELWLVPVPAKAAVYPEFLFDGFADASRVDLADHKFLELLREQGVQVVDLLPVFRGARLTNQLYCKTDTHWSGKACELTARVLKEKVEGEAWFNGISKRVFASDTRSVEIQGDLSKQTGAPAIGPEQVTLRFVTLNQAAPPRPIEPARDSPIILLGDSHNLVFHAGDDMHARGAGLPDQLALELGFPMDVIAVRGSGATPARINLLRRAREAGYLSKRKLVIWCFSVREFTEATSGWQLVPIVK